MRGPCLWQWGRVGGRQQALEMPHIACGLLPTRRGPGAIPMGHYHQDLVLVQAAIRIRKQPKCPLSALRQSPSQCVPRYNGLGPRVGPGLEPLDQVAGLYSLAEAVPMRGVGAAVWDVWGNALILDLTS